MTTREEKIKFLKDLKAGKQDITSIMPIIFKTFHNTDGVITDDTGKVFTMDEINANYSMSLNKCFVEILTWDNEEKTISQ